MNRDELNVRFGVTEEQLDEWNAEIVRGELPGIPSGPTIYGRPPLYGTALRSVTYRDDAAVIAAAEHRAQSAV